MEKGNKELGITLIIGLVVLSCSDIVSSVGSFKSDINKLNKVSRSRAAVKMELIGSTIVFIIFIASCVLLLDAFRRLNSVKRGR